MNDDEISDDDFGNKGGRQRPPTALTTETHGRIIEAKGEGYLL